MALLSMSAMCGTNLWESVALSGRLAHWDAFPGVKTPGLRPVVPSGQWPCGRGMIPSGQMAVRLRAPFPLWDSSCGAESLRAPFGAKRCPKKR